MTSGKVEMICRSTTAGCCLASAAAVTLATTFAPAHANDSSMRRDDRRRSPALERKGDSWAGDAAARAQQKTPA
jgi:hypothetical protein